MKRIFLIAMKDLKLVSRDKEGMFFMLVFPILMALFFGTVMGGGGGSSRGKLTISVTDEDQSDISKAFITALGKQDSVKVIELKRVDAANRIRQGKLTAMLVVPEGFGETAGIMWEEPPTIYVGIDPSRQAEAGMLQGYVMQASGELMATRFADSSTMRDMIDKQKTLIAADENMSPVMKPLMTTMMGTLDTFFDDLDTVQKNQQGAERDADGDADADGTTAGFQMQMAKLAALDIDQEADPDVKLPLNKRIRSSWDISFPQSMMWGVLSCVAGFAISIAQERTRGTYTRLQVAPLSRGQIVVGKALGCYLALLAVIAILISIGVGLGMRPKRWDLLLMAVLCTSFCFVGLMMVFALLGKTEQAVSGATWSFNMVFAMFGGAMIPIAFMPSFMASISNFSPVKWGVLSMEGAIWRGFSFSEMLFPCGVLIAIGTVGMLIGSRLLTRQS